MKEPVTIVPGRLGYVMKRVIRPMLFCLGVVLLPHGVRAQTASATIIIDNADAVFTGNWTTAFSSPDRYDKDYKFSSTATGTDPSATATYTPTIKTAGKYSVDIWYPQGQNRATNAPWIITYDGGKETAIVNQQLNGGQWVRIVKDKPFKAGTDGSVQLVNTSGTLGSVVVADGVRLVPAGVTASATTLASAPRSSTPTPAPGNATAGGKNFMLNITSPDGTVLRTPEEISYEPGKVVKLTPKPDTGFIFCGWSGDIGRTNRSFQNPLSIKMDGHKNITCHFESPGVGVILDNSDPGVEFKGGWTLYSGPWPGRHLSDYRFINASQKADALATYRPTLPKAGKYDVYVWHARGGNRTTSAPWTLFHKGGQIPAMVNQQNTGGKDWVAIATGVDLEAGKNPNQYVQLANNTTDADQKGRVVVADAVAFVYVGE